MKELVEHMAKSLVTKAEDAKVSERVKDDGSIELLLQVAPEDMGKVIGKQGRIAKAMRTVLKAASSREGKKVELEIE